MRRASLLLATLALFAATPGEVVPDLETRGYYIETGSNASADLVSGAVAEAGFGGGRLYVVVLGEEPDSGATFFSDAVLDQLGGEGTVLTVAPETVGYASDATTWSEEELGRAVDAGLDGSSDDDVVIRFVESLTGTAVGGEGGGGQAGGGSSGSGWIWFLVFGGGFLLLFLYLRSRTNNTAATARAGRLGQFREAAQKKLDAVANDILEMEDEVRLSENPEIQKHYASASSRYAEVIDAIGRTADPEQLLELTYSLDVAIWELDVAEAMLDGKQPPAKPERPKVEPPLPGPGPAGEQVITQPRPPPYDRRPQRQSSPAGPDLGSILLAILASQTFGRGSGQGGWSGAPRPGGGMGRMGGGGGRIRGGGRRRG